MENLTHSLLGATIAEVSLPKDATSNLRRLFLVSGIVAANLPDADLLYARITPPPLGYLLHHRGHTHTVVGCALLAGLFWLVTALTPPLKHIVAQSPGRFWLLIGAALASHLMADWWNSYGVHPFWPIDNRWYYGDAIYIAEPWFWVMMGTALVANARSWQGRTTLAVAGTVILAGAFAFHLITSGILAGYAIGASVLGALLIRRSPAARSSIALAAVALYVVCMFGLNRVVRAASIASEASLGAEQRGTPLDLISSPQAARPLCWTVLAVERVAASDQYLLRRGVVAPLPSIAKCGLSGRTAAWNTAFIESSSILGARAKSDCWVRAWLQFGRAPLLREDFIVDIRYGGPDGGGFSGMPLPQGSAASTCPPHLTHWSMPRADLLEQPASR